MKKISLMVGIAALAVMNATAQLRSPFGRSAQDDIPPEVAEKIPEDCCGLAAEEIRDKAFKQATTEAEEKFNILFIPGVWTNNCGKSVLFWVRNQGVLMCKYDKDGRLVQTGARNDFEEWRWRDARQKEIIEELWKNQSVVDAARSNAVAKVAKERRSPRRRELRMLMEREAMRRERDRLEGRAHLELLEELIPIEEAMGLAKDGKGKGFYQLALRYAGGNELPRNPELAYQMLCKARDLDYANAVLVEGLCDECGLCTPSMRFGGCSWVDKSSAMIDYCGVSFWSPFGSGRHRMEDCDSLTNEVAFARVMGKYEKARALGALAATNQIAALNKRLADFNAEKAECDRAKAKADANNRKVMDLLEMKEAAEQDPLDKLRFQLESMRRKTEAPFEEQDMKTKQKTEAARVKYRAAFKEMFGYEMGEKIAEEGTCGVCTKVQEKVDAQRAAVAAWNALVENLAAPSDRIVTKENRAKVNEALKRLPYERRRESAQSLLNLVPDGNFGVMRDVLFDPAQPTEVVDAIFNDLLNRPEEVKTPLLKEIAQDAAHANCAEARRILGVQKFGGK